MTTTLKVGVVSDTHGWLDPQLLADFAGMDLIVHAGDVGHDDVLSSLKAVAPVLAVRGNVDGGPLHFLPLTIVHDAGEHRLAVVHIAGTPARPSRDAERLVDDGADILVFGHSHVFVASYAGATLWLNPGAAGRQGLHDERTAAILEVADELSVKRIRLGPRGRASR